MGPTSHEVRTSETHPLRIAWLDPPHGAIGLRPGEEVPLATEGFQWSRDLDADLDTVRATGASALVCLLEDHELAPNGLHGLFEAAAARRMEVLRFPVRDGGTPDDVAELLGRSDDPRVRRIRSSGRS